MAITPNDQAEVLPAKENSVTAEQKVTVRAPANRNFHEKSRSYKLTRVNSWDEVRERMKDMLVK
jgi:hypothetical protein